VERPARIDRVVRRAEVLARGARPRAAPADTGGATKGERPGRIGPARDLEPRKGGRSLDAAARRGDLMRSVPAERDGRTSEAAQGVRIVRKVRVLARGARPRAGPADTGGATTAARPARTGRMRGAVVARGGPKLGAATVRDGPKGVAAAGAGGRPRDRAARLGGGKAPGPRAANGRRG
jgi:hypothetical protein